MTTNRTPAEAYAARWNDIQRLTDLLKAALADHRDRVWSGNEPGAWRPAAALDYIRTGLIDAIEGLTGRERGDIEAALGTPPAGEGGRIDGAVHDEAAATFGRTPDGESVVRIDLTYTRGTAPVTSATVLSRDAADALRDSLSSVLARMPIA